MIKIYAIKRDIYVHIYIYTYVHINLTQTRAVSYSIENRDIRNISTVSFIGSTIREVI